MDSVVFSKKQFTYTAYFCEENIWLLGEKLVEAGISEKELFVWILSNSRRQIPLYSQTLQDGPFPVLWDYHVILFWDSKNSKFIFDFDSTLIFPTELTIYFSKTISKASQLIEDYQIFIREIPLSVYHKYFHSDRSHMLDKMGKPLVPFPSYAPILSNEKGFLSLDMYLDMSLKLKDGSNVYPANELFKRLETNVN